MTRLHEMHLCQLAVALATVLVALLLAAGGLALPAYADDASQLVAGDPELVARPAADASVESADAAASDADASAVVAAPITALPAADGAADASKAAKGVSAKPSVAYKVYSKGKGWTSGWKKSGKTAGSAGARIQIAKLKVNKDGLSGGMLYRVKMYGKKWSPWVSGGRAAGAKGVAMMGVRIKLTGKLSKYFDVVYRVYHAKDGWLPWTMNGAIAGCRGDLGINQIQVKLVRKGRTPSLGEGTYLISLAKNSSYALAVPNVAEAGSQLVRAKYKPTSIGERVYLRHEADGSISLQSVMSGRFIGEDGGKVVLGADSSSASYRWTLEPWNGGYTIANVASGNKLGFAGRSAVSKPKAARWVFSSLPLIGNGNYEMGNNAQGHKLYLQDTSFANKANVRLYDGQAEEPGALSFRFTRKGADTYRIDCAASFKALEIADASRADGANVYQTSWKAAKSQLWKARLTRESGLVFTNVATGTLLTAAEGGSGGANVVASADAGSRAQAWTLSPSSFEGKLGLVRAVEKTASMPSATRYLVAVDLTNHWLTIFRGSKGNWKVYKDWQVSTGKPSTPTVVGNFTVGIKQYVFGHDYSCYYATQFYGDYLFHSVKYNEGTRKIQDGRLGQSISMGCVRMKIENAKWIYDHIPAGTAVKTFR